MIESITETIETSREKLNAENKDETTTLLYLYGTASLIVLCAISIAVNIKILVSVYWIRRPLSPTLHISLSLAGADAFSSTALAIGLIMNSFIPHGMKKNISGLDCFLLELEAIRLGAVIITVYHLLALAVNHYIGILKPLRYASIMTRRNITYLILLLWVLPLFFFTVYFSIIENEGFQSNECKRKTFLYSKNFRLQFSSLFFGPFLLMLCIYLHIFCVVKKHQALRSRDGGTVLRFRESDIHNMQSTNRRLTKNVKAVYTTLYILGSFAIGWMPGIFAYMLICEDCVLQFDWASQYVRFFVYHAINCLIILKTLMNSFIYAARMHEIKIATRRMHASFYKCIGLENLANNRNLDSRDKSRDTKIIQRYSSRKAVYRFTKKIDIQSSGKSRTLTSSDSQDKKRKCTSV